MDHADSRPFEGNYISRMIRYDTKAAFLGTPSQIDFVRAAGRMSRTMDSRRPTALTDEQIVEISRHSEIVGLTEELHSLRAQYQVAMERGEVATARRLQDSAHEVRDYRKSRRRTLRRERLVEVQAEHDTTTAVSDLQAQLAGQVVDGAEESVTSITYAFEERYKIAEALLNPQLGPDPEARISWQSSVLGWMISLCTREETSWWRHRQKREQRRDPAPEEQAVTVKETESPSTDADTLDGTSLIRDETECLYCLGNPAMSLEDRMHPFGGKWSLQRHTRRHHPFIVGACCPYPHPDCAAEAFATEELFLNHAGMVHGIKM